MVKSRCESFRESSRPPRDLKPGGGVVTTVTTNRRIRVNDLLAVCCSIRFRRRFSLRRLIRRIGIDRGFRARFLKNNATFNPALPLSVGDPGRISCLICGSGCPSLRLCKGPGIPRQTARAFPAVRPGHPTQFEKRNRPGRRPRSVAIPSVAPGRNETAVFARSPQSRMIPEGAGDAPPPALIRGH